MALDIHPDLPDETVPKQVAGFEIKKTACCFLLEQESTGELVKLNDTGMIIWQACTGEWNVGEIIGALQESYPDAAETMARDVYRTLDNMQDEGVITLDQTA